MWGASHAHRSMTLRSGQSQAKHEGYSQASWVHELGHGVIKDMHGVQSIHDGVQ